MKDEIRKIKKQINDLDLELRKKQFELYKKLKQQEFDFVEIIENNIDKEVKQI